MRKIVQFHERGLRALHKQLRGTGLGYGVVSTATLEAADACYAAFRALGPPSPAPGGEPSRPDTLSA